jgi:DUF1680 family protein
LRLAAEPGLTDTSSSPYAQVRTVGLDEVRWTRGFWADRFEVCRRQTIPALEAIMEGTNYSQFYQNFRIAAGLAEGRHRGPPFNDGDFYKWLEAASALFAVTKDPQLERHLDEIITVVARAQRADGYLHTPVLIAERSAERRGSTVEGAPTSTHDTRHSALSPFQNPLEFEMYNFGHLFTAACVHYRATGHTNFLAIAAKAADFLDQTFRQPTPELARNAICPSHYMGLVELYRATRQPRYLELAKRLLAMRDLVTDGTDDNQDRIPFEQQTEAAGHAVRANYLYAGAADLFAETGDHALWTPLEQIWTNVIEQKMYITGGCGALYDGASPEGAKNQKTITRVHQAYGRNYQLPNLTAHNETCANIGNVLWNWRMFLVTGQARFMDVLETALYNSVLSGGSLEGTNFFYTNPLRALEPLPEELRWPRQRVPFLSTFCCPPNLARTLAEAGNYAYGKSPDAIWLNLYGGSTLATELPDGRKVTLAQETDYPWNGRVRIWLGECGTGGFALNLRIPGWAKRASVRVNGLPAISAAAASYFELRRNWKRGDVVELDLPMPVRLIEANPFVEETFNQVAIERGPVVYCLESCDLPKTASAQHQPTLLDVTIPSDIQLTARLDRRLLGGVVVLEGKALARSEADWRGELYRDARTASLTPVDIRLIPYFAWDNRGPSEMTVWLPLCLR